MRRKLQVLGLIAALALCAACATMAGSMIGRGIGRAGGDEEAGALIGGGIGMMIDVMD